MKKTILLTMLFLILAILSLGCQKKQNQGGDIANSQRDDWFSRSDFQRQVQFDRPDLSGEVESIEANQITLKIVEIPEFGTNREEVTRQMNREDARESGRRFNRENQGEGIRQQDREELRQRIMNYSGETKTIIISEDIPMTKVVLGENGREEIRIILADIKQGDLLQVWYSDEEQTTISKISSSFMR